MDHISGASGTQPMQGEDDFDPYENLDGAKLEDRPQETTASSKKAESGSSTTHELSLEDQSNAVKVPETMDVEDQPPDVMTGDKNATIPEQAEQAYAIEIDSTDAPMIGKKKLLALSDSGPLEGMLPSPTSSSALHQTLPGLDTIRNERTEIDTKELAAPTDSTMQAVEVDDAESSLQVSETPIIEDQTMISGGEVEDDLSPYESSSDDTSSDSSDESEEDYELLDPMEQARRLMEGDGSDEEVGRTMTGGQLRTANETTEEVVEIPKIEGIADMRIEELGNVEGVVENMILIKAKTSGEYQVLESGSVLCLQDRTIIGVVSETLGRVQEPLYCVLFTDAATISGFGLIQGSPIYYVPQHSTFVFTKALQAVKGSDASNIHDEEIGGDEIEFSDDEAEAEYKRKKKLEKQERKGLRGGSTRGRGDFSRNGYTEHAPSDPSTLSYDDNMDDGLYTPLTRPTNLNNPGQILPPSNHSDGFTRGPGGVRGRDQRGRYRGGYRGRGGYNANGRGFQGRSTTLSTYSGHDQSSNQTCPPSGSQYSPSQQQGMYVTTQQFPQPHAFQAYGAQNPNQFQQYQQHQYANYQQPTAYSQAGQWPAYSPAAPGQPSPSQASTFWGQAIPGLTVAGYANPTSSSQTQNGQQPPG